MSRSHSSSAALQIGEPQIKSSAPLRGPIGNTIEIQEKLRKRYLQSLSTKMRRMRKDLVQRNWPTLRTECRSLRGSGENFGFQDLTELALRAETLIPEGECSRARGLPEARLAIESLILRIDQILIENSMILPLDD